MAPCKVCGGPVIPNPKKRPTKWKPNPNPNLPDFVCAQQVQICGESVQYTNYKGELVDGFNPTPQWIPKAGSVGAVPATTIAKAAPPSMVKAPNGADGYVPKEPTLIKEDEMWKRKGEQMNRSNLAGSVLQGKPFDWKLLMELEAWVLTGKTPAEINSAGTTEEEISIDNIPF